MRIAVISDLHLGSGGPADAFGHEESEFLRFLDFLENEFERIVLLGDIWETLVGPEYGDPVCELRRAREAHRSIAFRFQRRPYRYIHGNHDLVTGPAEGVPDHLLLDCDGMRLLFTHGHHHDWLVRRARWLSEAAIWLGGWLLRAGLGPLQRVGEHLEGLWSSAGTASTKSSFQRWAVAVARELRADVVVTGHTHVLARGDHGHQIFLNSGTCKGRRHSFLSIDTRRGALGLHSHWE